MDKLEKYLDQVCRSIGGPREMRQHVRQELREHLLDAMAQHKAAGLPEERALEQALEDFGGPEQVRAELEAAHGHRGMAVVIDKAIEWKERTMKARWLWTTWAFLGVTTVIALEIMFLTFTDVMIVPKFKVLMHHGLIDPAIRSEPGASWMPAFLDEFAYITGHYTTQMLLAALLAWGLFEWRIRSENKTFMRLAALGTAAVGLMVLVILMLGSLVVSFCLGMPATGRMARSYALEQVGHVEIALAALDSAVAKQEWDAMQEPFDAGTRAVDNMVTMAPVVPALVTRHEPPTQEELRANLTAAQDRLKEARQAMKNRDADGVTVALRRFQESFAPLAKAARKAPP